MKKMFAILTVLFVVVSLGAFAQVTDSASLNLSGTVGEFVSISVAPEPAATALTLQVGQPSLLQVATVTESSNVAYTVKAESANGFQFSDGTNGLDYTLYYDGAAVTSSGDEVSSGTSASGVARSVSVTYSAAPASTSEGTYADTVTFTIESN